MPKLTLKQLIILLVGLVGAILILIFQRGIYSQESSTTSTTPTPVTNSQSSEEPKVIATNPDPLENAVVLPNQTIEITFNLPIENIGELKNRIEPKLEYKIELSSDRKTAKFIPTKLFSLGHGYTIFILPDTKFDGKKVLKQEIIFHIRTIEYRGI